jgi:ATP-dependent DNA ligase
VRLYSRPGNDLTHRFPLIVDALARLRSRSCIIDGEAVACDDKGIASFGLVRHHKANERIFLYAFQGIVSKRKNSACRSGRSPDWLKMKNPACVAVTRESEEDWAR